ncbi:two component transcriptional regulator, LuxR family [Noviherbaspirillum humi]|uniref:Two component transcriptional regulator, LuxR family n=1 Tax=Noviherbaspirillum humi TaxID=1688639 RepID=A0A239GY04_9BURK|nr:response regulator transcription factor [Noviherbaspirillum humi]SNS72924.1 two component transcriptional regulator, LuxR family [Noviherbaspirillum humi]
MSVEKIRVLLVDDHTVARNGMRLMLGAAPDLEVTGEAETVRDALAQMKREAFDVALVDISLPDKSGLELLKLMREQNPKMAVVIMSMYGEDVYAIRAFKHGAAGYLTKNSSSAEVVSAVRKAAGGGKYVSPAMVEKMASMLGGGNLSSHEGLSDRELDVMKMIAAGESLVAIAERLHLSPSTVTTYRARILEKMGMKSNAELTRYAFEHGLLG